jgi:hypothetical protein
MRLTQADRDGIGNVFPVCVPQKPEGSPSPLIKAQCWQLADLLKNRQSIERAGK